MKRVYHPTLNTWQDVPDGDVDSWAEAGWKKSQPKHVTGDLPPVGEHPGIARVPVLEDVSADTATATTTTATSGRGSATT